MKPIGGYFELELNRGQEYHRDAIKLNTGRNCFEYILRTASIKKIYIPAYTCSVLLEPIKKLQIKYDIYHIDENLDPIFNKVVLGNEALLYTNYFGIKDKTVKKLSRIYKNKLIVDNAQSFFSKPQKILGTFYSPRKFLGLPDGGYLYYKQKMNGFLSTDLSFERMEHLLRRLDTTPELGYKAFVKNDKSLSNQPIKKMSNITSAILQSIDYKEIKKRRMLNFIFLHNKLKNLNELKIDLNNNAAPMVYPFLYTKKELHEFLIGHKIYIAKYWEETVDNYTLSEFENKLVSYCVPLPIDHRYDINHMKMICKYLKEIL